MIVHSPGSSALSASGDFPYRAAGDGYCSLIITAPSAGAPCRPARSHAIISGE